MGPARYKNSGISTFLVPSVAQRRLCEMSARLRRADDGRTSAQVKF